MTADGGLTRRERQREATVAEIVAAGRSALHDPHGLSLRAVAAAVGMTPPAVYRYVDSYDELALLVAADVYDEVVAVITESGERQAVDDPAARIVAAAAAFRRWSLAHRDEFALIFANPVTAATGGSENACSMAGARFGAYFADLFVQLWRRYDFDLPVDASAADQVTALADAPMKADFAWPEDVPAAALWLHLRVWSRLYGTVTMEVFGHVDAWVVESGELFADMMADCGRLLGLGEQQDRLLGIVERELRRGDEGNSPVVPV